MAFHKERLSALRDAHAHSPSNLRYIEKTGLPEAASSISILEAYKLDQHNARKKAVYEVEREQTLNRIADPRLPWGERYVIMKHFAKQTMAFHGGNGKTAMPALRRLDDGIAEAERKRYFTLLADLREKDPDQAKSLLQDVLDAGRVYALRRDWHTTRRAASAGSPDALMPPVAFPPEMADEALPKGASEDALDIPLTLTDAEIEVEIAKTDYHGVTGRVSFDPQGDIRDGAVTFYQVRNGKWEVVSSVGGARAT